MLDTIGLTSSITSLERNADCFCTCVQPDHHYFRVRNVPAPSLLNLQSLDDTQLVYLSDRLIFEVTCRKCGEVTSVYDRADRYDESLEICPRCDEKSNDVVIRDTMTVKELARRFSDRPLPLKYLYFTGKGTQIILEMEENHE